MALFGRPLEPDEIELLYRQGTTKASLANLIPPQPDAASTAASTATVKEVVLEIGEVNTIRAHQADKHVESVAFSSDGSYLVTGSNDRTVKVWSAKDGQPLAERADVEHDVRAVTFLGSNDLIAFSARRSSSLQVWNWRTANESEY